MKPNCPNIATNQLCSKDNVLRDGHFYRASESRWIQRFKCKNCGRKFSHATGTLEFGQRKRHLNRQVRHLLCSKVSMRRAAYVLSINRRTVERKMHYLAKRARYKQREMLQSLEAAVTHLQFDDQITAEHTKLKPVTISIAVDVKRRLILGAEVGRIPSSGLLAAKSRKKYGPRPSEHGRCLKRLFQLVASTIAPEALVQSDEHWLYPKFVKHYLVRATHVRHPGGRASVAGYGELKNKTFDPLFGINHTCATFRDDLARLGRRTWCTTKKIEQLQMQLDIMIEYENEKRFLKKKRALMRTHFGSQSSPPK